MFLNNSAIIFGPNSFPAHNSVIYTAEVQAEFTRKALIEPLMFGKGTAIDVTQAAEDHDSTRIQIGLKDMVWEAGCSNWYLNEWGRNTASYHGKAAQYWLETMFPKASDFIFKGAKSSLLWRVRSLLYQLSQWKKVIALIALSGYVVRNWTQVRCKSAPA
jgi:hypothetical protein